MIDERETREERDARIAGKATRRGFIGALLGLLGLRREPEPDTFAKLYDSIEFDPMTGPALEAFVDFAEATGSAFLEVGGITEENLDYFRLARERCDHFVWHD